MLDIMRSEQSKYNLRNIAVMIKRKSTLDHNQKAKRNKQTEIFAILDLCLQVPTDDRILIRNRIKEGDQELSSRVYQCKKDKNYQTLQIYLRKYVQKHKKNNGSFGAMGFYSKDCSSRRGKTPLTLKSRGVATESSCQNSFQNSLQSSPSGKKPPAKAQITLSRFEIEKHIEREIDREIEEGINNQQCIPYCRGITPRQQQNSSLFINPSSEPQSGFETPHLKYSHILSNSNKINSSQHRDVPLNIKTMLKEKMKNKLSDKERGKEKRITLNRDLFERQGNFEEKEKPVRNSEKMNKSSFYYKTIANKYQSEQNEDPIGRQFERQRTPTGSSGYSYRRQSYREEQDSDSCRNPRYGEFYKRIRKAIEGDE